MDEERIERLTLLFKALADPARLRILGAVAEGPLTGRELSERLRLSPPTISHHMARLVGADLVRATPDAQRRHYALNKAALRDAAQVAAGGSRPAASEAGTSSAPPATADDAARTKTLRAFFVDGRLKQMPAQRKKRVVVLQHLLERFSPGRDYPEREVNDLLRPAHPDVATLRRELVDYGFMTRTNGIYRVAMALPARGPTVAQEIGGDERAWLRRLVLNATDRIERESTPGNG